MTIEKSRENALSIFRAALERVDPREMIHNCCSLDHGIFSVETPDGSYSCNLEEIRNIYVLGVGKAAAKMALGIEDILGDRVYGGCAAVKYGHAEALSRISIIEAGHPVPDDKSIEAAGELLRIASEAGRNDLVITLISGGGSAIAAAPVKSGDTRCSLKDLQILTGELLACGADIHEINCIRKHLSEIKGGRLAAAISPARSVSLVLSDVVGDNLDVIASGLTVPDSTTFQDAEGILLKYNLLERVPVPVRELINRGLQGKIPETPKPTDAAFDTAETLLIGTNRYAVTAAAEKAGSLGYNTLVLGSRITGESREIARVYSGIAKEAALRRMPYSLPLCIIGGGETTVTLRGKGKGGRNQEMALAFLNEYKREPSLLLNTTFLSGGTDGNDGPTDAAGGLINRRTLELAKMKELDPADYIAQSDSYHFLKQTESLLVTGPTKTNVCDIQIILEEMS